MRQAQSNTTRATGPVKPAKSRSFCCSMFVYTLVFVSGVVVATVLPELVGHHFKQPYGKKYAALAEEVFQDLPTYLKKFSDSAVLITEDLGNKVWQLKTEIERRFQTNEPPANLKSKTATSSKKTAQPHTHAHGEH